MTLRARILLLTAVYVAALAICGAVVTSELTAARERDEEVTRRLGPAGTLARALLADFVDQETGLRGFIITGDDEFLEPYARGAREARGKLEDLRRLLADYPLALADLEAVARYAAEWRREVARPEIAAIRRGDEERAEELVADRTIGAPFEMLRAELAQLQRRVAFERVQAVDATAEAERHVATALAIVGGVLVLLIVVASVLASRSVVRPVKRLQESLRRVAAGDLDTAVAATGPPEVQAVGRDAEAMRRRILDELEEARAAREGLAQGEPVVAFLREQLRPTGAEPGAGVRLAGVVHSAEGVLAGDWYDVVVLPDDRIAVVVADVSGHGAIAAGVAAMFKQSVLTALRLGHDGATALRGASEVLGDPERFVTCVIAELDPATGAVHVTNAGHPPPLVLAPTADGGVQPGRELGGDGPPVSLLGGARTPVEERLAETELLLLYTDGLVEARDAQGRAFGGEGVRRALSGVRCPDPEAILDACLRAAQDHRGGERRDDITLVVVGRAPAALRARAEARGAGPWSV